MGIDGVDDEAARIARALLPEAVAAEVTSAVALVRALDDHFLPRLRVFPAETLDVERVRASLGEGGGARVSIESSGETRASLLISSLPSTAFAKELSRVTACLRAIGTHARIVGIELETGAASEGELELRVSLTVPLQNELFSGEVPKGDSPAIEPRGHLDPTRSDLDIEEVVCPACDAVHVIASMRPLHAQDSEDEQFVCLRCHRVRLQAYGIRELVRFRIDLAERFRRERGHVLAPSSPTGLSPLAKGWLLALGAISFVTLVGLGVNRSTTPAAPSPAPSRPAASASSIRSCDEAAADAEKALKQALARRPGDAGAGATLERALSALASKHYDDARAIVDADPALADDPLLMAPLLVCVVACGEPAHDR